MINRLLLPVAAALLSTALLAQDLPQPSPRGHVQQVVGLTKVDVDYSRPVVKDRTIFGTLLPFGKLWRTGANATTTVEFSGPVTINGSKLEAGKYSLFTIPGKEVVDGHLQQEHRRERRRLQGGRGRVAREGRAEGERVRRNQ